ncbi:MAG: Fic family protein [Verrucomicrobiales bacterium]
MNPADFSPSQRPLCRRQPEGYHAFHPPPLPPLLAIDWKLTSLLSETDRAVAELSGAGRQLPNPHLLIRPYLRREAILSSRIEDTIAEVDDLLLFEVEPDQKPRHPDILEVVNHVQALETGLRRLDELPISSRLIRELHSILLRSVRGGESAKTPGEFRRSQNWIGRPGATLNEATYVPPPPGEVDPAIGALENYLHADSEEPTLVKAALLHYQFEAIHPFLDGNGRIGRLLVTLYLCATGCLSQPLLYLSAFFEEHRDDYYRHLLSVSRKGAWRGWLEYFLTGVRETAVAALGDTNKILALHQSRRLQIQKTKRVPAAAAALLDAIFGGPIISITAYAKASGEPFQKISNAVDFWVRQGLLHEMTGNRRNRLFIADEVLHIMTPRPTGNAPDTQAS